MSERIIIPGFLPEGVTHGPRLVRYPELYEGRDINGKSIVIPPWDMIHGIGDTIINAASYEEIRPVIIPGIQGVVALNARIANIQTSFVTSGENPQLVVTDEPKGSDLVHNDPNIFSGKYAELQTTQRGSLPVFVADNTWRTHQEQMRLLARHGIIVLYPDNDGRYHRYNAPPRMPNFGQRRSLTHKQTDGPYDSTWSTVGKPLGFGIGPGPFFSPPNSHRIKPTDRSNKIEPPPAMDI